MTSRTSIRFRKPAFFVQAIERQCDSASRYADFGSNVLLEHIGIMHFLDPSFNFLIPLHLYSWPSTVGRSPVVIALGFGGLVAKGLGRAVASGNGPLEGSSSQRKVQIVDDGVSHLREDDGANPQSDPDVGVPHHLPPSEWG